VQYLAITNYVWSKINHKGNWHLSPFLKALCDIFVSSHSFERCLMLVQHDRTQDKKNSSAFDELRAIIAAEIPSPVWI
jgi:hypothetical protein